MGKNQSTRKSSLSDWLVVAFAVITMSLLVVQLGINVADTLQTESVAAPTPQTIEAATPAGPATPVEPTPTFDIGSVEIKDF